MLNISLKNNSKKEKDIKNKLINLLKKYDASKFIYTKNIIIDEDAQIPHSRPVLTLNTNEKYGNNELMLLSVFLHEQFHWFEDINREKITSCIKDLVKKYPEVPVNLPEGAGTRFATYVHLIINYYEFWALGKLIGGNKAKEVIGNMKHYTWVYKTILKDKNELKEILNKNGLLI